MSSAFFTPLDIANRALQHIGQRQMDLVAGFSENSRAARETGAVYDKLRQAELRRSYWRFAIRRAVLRPVDPNTMLLAPALWVSSTTYFVGSVVADASGSLWISRIPNNLGLAPQSSGFWEPYFGPMTVMLYDSSQTYDSGELVYTLAGDGTYNTYFSINSANAVHPALPNIWSTNTTYFINQVVQIFPAWSSLTTYTQGQTVLYTDGNYYSSLVNGNLNVIPPSNTAKWALVPTLILPSQQVSTQPTPPTIPPFATPIISTPVAEWNELNSYSTSTFVMFNGTEYVAIANSTGQFPNAAGSTFWSPLTLGTFYMNLFNLNLGNNPTNSAANWSSLTTYAIGNKVNGSDNRTYTSLSNGNLNNNPVTDGGVHWSAGGLTPWTSVFTQGGGNQQWIQIGGASFPTGVGLSGLNLTYPINTGPTTQVATRNIFHLPAGFMREAPQDPKAGSSSFLGAPSMLAYNDWEYEGNYIVSRMVTPIVYRFVADVVDVTTFDPMFCEMLACKIGIEVCETLTQSTTKIGTVASEYKRLEYEAIAINGIECGPVEPPMDDYLLCRI